MARKGGGRKKKAERVEPDAGAVDTEQLQPYEPPPDGITTSLWNGLMNYHCPQCPFATIDRPEFDAHLRHHGPKVRDTGLVDKEGKPIAVEVPIE